MPRGQWLSNYETTSGLGTTRPVSGRPAGSVVGGSEDVYGFKGSGFSDAFLGIPRMEVSYCIRQECVADAVRGSGAIPALAPNDEASGVTSRLAGRIQDLPGVASVVVDLDDPDSAEIRLRFASDADEAAVIGRVRSLLAAYGVRSRPDLHLRVGRDKAVRRMRPLGVDVRITPIKGGARVEVIGRTVRSFRIVPPNALAIVQGVADAWCQVEGRIPVEIVGVSMGRNGEPTVIVSNGTTNTVGRADVSGGWANAIAEAVGTAIGILEPDREESRLVSGAW